MSAIIKANQTPPKNESFYTAGIDVFLIAEVDNLLDKS